MADKEKREIAKPVADFLREGKRIPTTEFSFKGTRFDVLGYNEDEKCFYVVECKLSKSIAGIGKTLGQILGYHSAIAHYSHAFLDKVNSSKEREWFQFRDNERIILQNEFPVKFFVALKKENAQKNIHHLEWIDKNILDDHLGIILVDKNKKCEIIKQPKPYKIPIERHYRKREEFLKDIKEKTLVNSTEVEFNSIRNVIRYYFGNHGSFTFKVWLKRNGPIEIGFYMERDKKNNHKLFQMLLKYEKKISAILPYAQFEKKYGRRRSWRKIYENIEWDGKINSLNGELLDKVSNLLCEYVKTLKPILDEVEWGKIER
ncbi:MAG: hypothetical protein ABSF36_06965 [Candidatus Methanomethylicaceae archaeon]|jgi:hypothetical protein